MSRRDALSRANCPPSPLSTDPSLADLPRSFSRFVTLCSFLLSASRQTFHPLDPFSSLSRRRGKRLVLCVFGWGSKPTRQDGRPRSPESSQRFGSGRGGDTCRLPRGSQKGHMCSERRAASWKPPRDRQWNGGCRGSVGPFTWEDEEGLGMVEVMAASQCGCV